MCFICFSVEHTGTQGSVLLTEGCSHMIRWSCATVNLTSWFSDSLHIHLHIHIDTNKVNTESVTMMYNHKDTAETQREKGRDGEGMDKEQNCI